MIGRILGNRYEILEEIGSGGMAVVYKAYCSFLRRNVAIKVLREEYARNEEFIQRFRTESSAAANLTHPNIVSIYDVGEENGINYIVMELVEGITLKEYIAERTMLKWQVAVEFAKQICSALACAHKNGTVHRDIKPHNIMVAKDDTLKVMDFGIARAATSSTVTMSGSTIGSVHYFSPEQARGGYVDEKSDIYAVGIVLYEMLTGRVPFDGDSPIAVAIKQIQELPESPRDYNMSVPLVVAAVAMKAIEKNPTERYATAFEMFAALEDAKNPSSERKAIASAREEATRRVPVVTVPADVSRHTDVPDDAANAKNKKLAKTLPIIAAAVIVCMLALGFTYMLFPDVFGRPSQDIVPDLVGRNIDAVITELQNSNFRIEILRRENSSEVAVDCIIEQNPLPGKVVTVPREIKVVVSNGAAVNYLDDYAGKEKREAIMKLEEMGIKVEVVEEVSEIVTQGYVIRTSPAPGKALREGDEVTLYVSKGGGREITMPDLTGQSLESAKAMMEQYNLILGRTSEEESDRAVGSVIGQSVAKGDKTKEYATIDLVLAKPRVTPTPTSGTKEVTVNFNVTRTELSQINVTIENGIFIDVSFVGSGVIAVRLSGAVGSTAKVIVNEQGLQPQSKNVGIN